MLALFRFEYGTQLTQEQTDKLAPLLHGELKPDPTFRTFTGDLAAVAKACPELLPSIRLELPHEGVGLNALQLILQKLEDLAGRGAPLTNRVGPRPWHEGPVAVMVPGNGLLEINDVTMLENACTDVLMAKLDEGWRIIAVCPQPDQRRPDYILGRHYRER